MRSTVTRRLEFDAGHRVLGHGGQCAHPHGHRYAVDVECRGRTDEIDIVIDFGDVKRLVGDWIDRHLDHAFLVAERDVEMADAVRSVEPHKIHVMKTNPTAEGIAEMLLGVARDRLGGNGSGLDVVAVTVWETPNCRARAEAGQ